MLNFTPIRKRFQWRKSTALALALTFGLALAGCGNNAASNAAANGAAASNGGLNTSSNSAGAASSSTDSSSNTTTASADKKLTVYSAGPEGLATKLIEGYEAKTGVKVEMFQGTTGKILARMEAEKANPVADVVILASLPSAQGLKDEGLTLPYPDAVNADKLNPDWSDPEGNYFSTSASALGIAYNTKLVKTPPASWEDLAKPEFKDQVNIPDPSLSGSALDFMTGYLSLKGDSGWSLFEDYKKNGVAMAGANQEALDPVITGAKGVVAAAVDYMTYKAKQKGEPVDIVYPAEGTVISPRPAAILKSTQHEANAKAFIDYLLSDEAQKLVSDAALLPGRTDIKAENRANLNEIPQFKVDWNWMNENGADITEKFTKMFK
ncbi:ABC transporter substrate-binding protein [Paenibacillus yonginensis]|uniref:ABC transporter substrate-binding protein n=1 Tax=Paenibacillus yonginensis TaxID=1462996 RepID=A0A1B1N4V1_9BACL|nr:ABC transporter substrate-binding protein [Paenibacillus yonginensis]ANS76436.1 ABC transporter substrate-binding protein [Paenibacillus yonginensis]